MSNDMTCPHCGKTKMRGDEEKRALMNRLSRIEGQIRGLRGMIEKDAYFPDVLTQAAAATAALNSFSRQLLSEHIHSCVMRDIRSGDESTVDELVALMQNG